MEAAYRHVVRRLIEAVRTGNPTATAALGWLARRPSTIVADDLWRAALDSDANEALWTLARASGRPMSYGEGLTSRIALEDPLLDLDDRFVRLAFLRAVGMHPHPIADLAGVRAVAHPGLGPELLTAAFHSTPVRAWCAANDVVPTDPVDRAAFLVLLRDFEQYHAADPDGTLLATAYREADAYLRSGLRAGIADSGDFDLVRVVAASDRAATLAPEEAEFLVERLVHRKRWAEVWRLIRDLPLEYAVAAARRMTEWEPDDAGERELLALYRSGAGHGSVSTRLRDAGLMTLQKTAVHHDHAGDVAISPDGARVATPNYARRVVDWRSADGSILAEHAHPDDNALMSRLLHLGDAILFGAERLIRFDGTGSTVLSPDRVHALVRAGDGYAAAASKDTLLISAGHGPPTRVVTCPGEVIDAVLFDPRNLASSPDRRLLAVCGPGLASLTAAGDLLATGEPGPDHRISTVRFLSDDTLITVDRRYRPSSPVSTTLRRWNWDGSRLATTLSVPVDPAEGLLVVWPDRRTLALGDARTLTFRDAATFEPTDPPDPRIDWTGIRLTDLHADHGWPAVIVASTDPGARWRRPNDYGVKRLSHGEAKPHLYWPLGILAEQSPSAIDPAALARLEPLATARSADPLVRLLYIHLTRRLEADITLGSGAVPPPGASDISVN